MWKELEVPFFNTFIKLSVSDVGEIRVGDRTKMASDNGAGYKTIIITRGRGVDRKQKRYYVHRLVASCYIGDVSGKDINHKNFNRADNRLVNLEIVTRTENILHSLTRRKFINSYEQYTEVLYLHFIKNVPIKEICSILSVPRHFVSSVVLGRRSHYKNRYLSEGNKYNITKFRTMSKVPNSLKNPNRCKITGRIINKVFNP